MPILPAFAHLALRCFWGGEGGGVRAVLGASQTSSIDWCLLLCAEGVWIDLFGGTGCQVLLRHANTGEEWVAQLSGTALHLPGDPAGCCAAAAAVCIGSDARCQHCKPNPAIIAS